MSGEDRRVVWIGRLERGEAPGTVVGWMEEVGPWKWRIVLTGTRDVEGGGYILEGRLGPVPAALAVPLVDDPVVND